MFGWFKNLLQSFSPEQKLARIAFIVSKPEEIERLRLRGKHPDNTHLINSALTIYEWALDSLDAGWVPGRTNLGDGSFRELSTPEFDKIKKETPWGIWESSEDL